MRTLYEINITANFIAEHGNDISKRYLDYHFIEEYKYIMRFQENHERLGLAPMSKDKVDEYKLKRSELLKKYGKNYVESYGWAWPIFSKKKASRKKLKDRKITFADIEKKVNFDQWRPYFGLASQRVHASPKSILSGIDPRHIGKVTTISLHQLTSALIAKPSTMFNSKGLIGLMVMDRYKIKISQELEYSAIERDKRIIEPKTDKE